MTDAIRLEGVGKRYWKLEEQAMLLRSLLPFTRPKRSELWASRGVDLTIEQGEVVGVVGRNGAGKTTLLRMLAGVTRPTEGRITISGRVAPLISVGVGFHKEMSGRENIYVNGLLLGLTKNEVDERFDAIVQFAELADFVDTPVKFYSSGMFMRLGFSVAVHTDPQILLVDEVLAVGDLAFQMKCLEKMKAIRQSGTTIVFVSHFMPAIRLLCPRALVFRKGVLDFDGDSEAAIARHHELLWADSETDQGGSEDHGFIGGVRVVDRLLMGPEGRTNTGHHDQPLELHLRVAFDRAVDSPRFNFTIYAEDGTLAYTVQSPMLLAHNSYQPGDEGEVVLRFTPSLGGGNYRITWAVTSADGREIFHADEGGLIFHIDSRLWIQGVADLGGLVSVDGRSLEEDRSFGLSGPEATLSSESKRP